MPIEDHIIHLENGVLAADTPVPKVASIVSKAVAHGGNGIVVHFHGGLVKYSNGVSIAEALCDEYLDAGAYPVFFVWESGLVETVTNNLGQISGESFFKLLWKRLASIVMRKMAQNDLQRSSGQLPPADEAAVQAAINTATATGDVAPLIDTEPQIEEMSELTDAERLALEMQLATDFELTTAVQQISNGLRTPAEIEADRTAREPTIQGSTATLMDPAAIDRLVDRPDPAERGLITTAKMIKAVVSIAGGLISRFIRERDHGFHATIVEEILRELYLANVGKLIWSQMKLDTADAFGADATKHGGTAFLTELRDAIGADDPPAITLVGHSTGAVYISEFLDKAAEIMPPNVKFGVVFEAPAATFERAAEMLEKREDRIAGFRMFTMHDAKEREDRLVPVLYPHSLLYFVSGVVEGAADTPIVGMERFYDEKRFPADEFPKVKAVREFIAEVDGRVAWSITPAGAAEGCRTSAVKHGDFDDQDPATLASVKHIVGHGF
jgi:hypothetical protein